MAVYKRGNKNVFYMNFTINGVRVFKSTGKFTKKEAKQAEAMERQKIMIEASMSPQEKAAKMLLSDAVDHVYNTRWKNTKDANGAHRRALRLVELIGNIPLAKINEDAVHKMILILEASKIEVATINRYLAALKTLLKALKQPTDYIKLRKERSGRIRVISREEESTVVNMLRNTKHNSRRHYFPDVADLVEVLIDTGCRLSEVLDLRYDDINFETNLISIWINKGDRPRSIPMTERVRTILQSRKIGSAAKPFTIDKHQAGNAWDWSRKHMGFMDDPEFLLHALRHTCASRLVNAGIDLYVVCNWLGHSSIQITQRYAHLNPMKLSDAVLVLEPC
ncbi:MAG: site-specific integrase [Desulfuromonadales bacterium]|nr:site-specific integrase [Desulfuromonadales bacterium]